MAQEYFLRIDGIDGESTDAKHPQEIQLDGWEFSDVNATNASGAGGAGGGSGKVSFKDFRFTKPVDKTSIPLFLASCQGTRFKSAMLTCRRSGAQPFEFLTVSLSNVVITSYDALAGAPSGGAAVDQVTLGFARIVLKYSAQGANGAPLPDVSGGWDLQSNTKV